jgi:hypothetical protein
MRSLVTVSIVVVAALVLLGHLSASAGDTASVGSATFTAASPGGSTPLGGTVQVSIKLSSFTSGSSTTWGGYDLEVRYDTSIVIATSDVIGGSNPCGTYWQNTALTPEVVSLCFRQSSAFTATLETITFTCNKTKSGVSAIHIVPTTDPSRTAYGSVLFDEVAVPFDMTFVDGSITCGLVPTSTPAGTPTQTDTPAPTSTPAPRTTPAPSTPTGPSIIEPVSSARPVVIAPATGNGAPGAAGADQRWLLLLAAAGGALIVGGCAIRRTARRSSKPD